MKLTRLAWSLLVAALAVSGCNYHDGNSSASAAPESLPTGPGIATLSWEAPTTTTQGSQLTDLAGYRIYYGINRSDLSGTVQLNSVGLQTYVLDNLGQGTWYFAIRAVTSMGVESPLSNVVSKTIS